MDIQFCDICSESVPLHDLEVGRAKRFGGRVVCKNCDEAMTRHVAPAAQHSAQAHGNDVAPRAAGGGTVWLAASCVGVMGLLAYLSVQRVEDAEARVQSDFAGQLAGVERRLGLLDTRLERLAERREEPAAADPRLDAIADALADIGRRLEEHGGDQALLAAFAALDARLDDQVLTETQRRAESDRKLAELTLEVERTRGDLALLARALLDELAAAAAATPPAEPVAPPEPIGAPWLAFVGGLSSSDDSERWNSVEELGASGDPAAAPHVVPVLTDPEMFVRMAAARVLGALGNEIAIEPLVRALDDPEPSVREAAYASLCKLSGKSFVFEPNAEPKTRAKQVEAWRSWLAQRATSGS